MHECNQAIHEYNGWCKEKDAIVQNIALLRYSVMVAARKYKVCYEVCRKIGSTPWLIGALFSSLITVRKQLYLNLVLTVSMPSVIPD